MNSKSLALSAISASFIAIFLTVGAYFSFIDLITVIFASAFVLLPLYYNSYLGSALSFVAGGIIAFLFSGFNIYSLVFPAYFFFFGCFPIIKIVLVKKGVKNIFSIIIGLIWCIAFSYGLYFYYIFVMKMQLSDFPEIIVKYIYFFIPVFAVIIFFIFDRFVIVVKMVEDKYLKRIIK